MTAPGLDAPIRRPLLAAWLALSIVAAGLVALLVQFWGARPEYADRFLILLASGWIAYSLRSTAPASRPRLGQTLPPALLFACLIPLAAHLQTRATGGRTVLLWFDAAVFALGVVALLLAEGGWRRVRHFAFPMLFPAFALPLPSRVLGPLQNLLQEATTSISATALPWLGLTVERSGFVLRLAAGDLGVAEACSGVQSVTALTALAAFVAHRKGFGPCRGTLLVLLAVPIVVVVNAIRVIASGLIQEHAGRDYIRGDWHDALGFGLLFVGLAAILGMARSFSFRAASVSDRSSFSDRSLTLAAPKYLLSAIISTLVVTGSITGAAAYFHGLSREIAVAQDAPLEALPLEFDGWRGTDRPIPDEVTALLGQDRILHRTYENNLGQRVFVWVIYWSNAKLVKGYHHPDVCWGNKGFRATAQRTETLDPQDCGAIPATAREFLRGTRETQFVLYWTQEGSRIWTDADERSAQAETGFLTHPDWLGDELAGKPAQPTGRLVVLVGTESATALAQAEALRFARGWAAEVYRVCPWAKPER